MTTRQDARSFVTIMVFIAVFALVLRITIDQVIRLNISSNESGAQTTLKLISTALENYSRNNQGVFPSNIPLLIKTKPSYLDEDYISDSPIKGYNYSCSRLEPNGYSCSATPVKCKLTGNAIYTISTGGLLTSEESSKKD